MRVLRAHSVRRAKNIISEPKRWVQPSMTEVTTLGASGLSIGCQVPIILAFAPILSPVEPSSPETPAERITLPSVPKERQQVVPMGISHATSTARLSKDLANNKASLLHLLLRFGMHGPLVKRADELVGRAEGLPKAVEPDSIVDAIEGHGATRWALKKVPGGTRVSPSSRNALGIDGSAKASRKVRRRR
jgi:hypothetical protein